MDLRFISAGVNIEIIPFSTDTILGGISEIKNQAKKDLY
jgi:hypothetical protein